jgi:hypothetical protein
MMRFPLRLARDLALNRAGHALRWKDSWSPITFIDPAEILHQGSPHPIDREKIQSLVSSPASVLWIRGSEPLDHPGIAHLIRALSNSRRFIFLETGAVLLRRRIHEFQPLPNFTLFVRLDSASSAPDNNPLSPSPWTLALEGIRAAQLSGFFVAAHSIIHSHSSDATLTSLATLIQERALDGWVITPAARMEDLRQLAARARHLIPSALWQKFSTRVEPELLTHSIFNASLTLPMDPIAAVEDCEESVKVS